MPEQMDRLPAADDRGDRVHVGAERAAGVGLGVVGAGGLVLPAQVDRDDPAPGVGQRLEDRDEILLAPRVSRDEQRRPSLDDAGNGHGLEGRERADRRFNPPRAHPGRQGQEPRRTHDNPLTCVHDTEALAERHQ